ncbi:hypothetical protein COM38_26940 [Bacillus toyonensis]|uniref:hypothetical protein n=1 Tax=Bacillus cereus group TaxID=86661 RepID=UPI000B434401|nr:hypothetical protein [Bacillus toyonensis]OUB44257.1 hypothetical protein BK740_14190 [Bacillus thuringiensis serovar argentinensis]PGD49329.1 hypothetical protein COM38_26940 [Bacillus toyonensis]
MNLKKRRLDITGNISFENFPEFPGTPERCDRTINRSVHLEPDDQYMTILTMAVRCGDDCFTELDIQAKVIKETGDIVANVYTKFYDVKIDGTKEKKDSKSTPDFLIRRGKSAPLTHNLRKPEVMDFSRVWDTSVVTLNFTNFLVED